MKAPTPASTLQLLHMNSSAGGIQDQQSNNSQEDIFPSNTSAIQKDQISEMVKEFSDKYKIFKQQNS